MKFLIKGLKKTGGRNNYGRVTSRHRGGGHKRRYRIIDFKRQIKKGLILTTQYDPNRSAFIMLIKNINNFEKKKYTYILATHLNTKQRYIEFKTDFFKNGDFGFLRDIPLNTPICGIEKYPGSGAVFNRAAGASGKIIQKNKFLKKVLIELQSGITKVLHEKCCATVGSIKGRVPIKKYKAGQNRWLNKRPHVRGVAMNPIDHPHGGGEGKTSGGRVSVTPWGIYTKGFKTRNPKKKKKEKKMLKSIRLTNHRK